MAFDFSILPAHVISQILEYLNIDDFKNASSVCKSWYYASTDPKIAKTLILKPEEKYFSEICKSNRRYGILNLCWLEFYREDSYYFELFEKFCPFIYQLQIISCDLRLHHFLKLLQLTTNLKILLLVDCEQLEKSSGLFPPDYDRDVITAVVKNLKGIKRMSIFSVDNTSLVIDLVRGATNLKSIEFDNEFTLENLFAIFDHLNDDTLVDLISFIGDTVVYGDDFISRFLQIKNLNLRLFKVNVSWDWRNGIYKSSLFRQFILRLQNLVDLHISGLNQDQLSIMSQHLVNLKCLNLFLDNNQPISELGNLKQLEVLCCGFSNGYQRLSNEDEINKFFKLKFENLRVFNFYEMVTEPNLAQFCKNHQNLIELKLTCLLTRNLEIIFKYLTKLRFLSVLFDKETQLKFEVDDVQLINSTWKYEYKITRLQDLEDLILDKLMNCDICEDDLRQLKKLQRFELM